MGKGRKLRWNILVVLAAAAFLLFLAFIVLMVWGVRWMGGQKDFRRELADSIGDSVLEGVTATGPAGETSEPRLDDLNRLLLYITDCEYFVSFGGPEEGAQAIRLDFGDGSVLTFTQLEDGVRAEFTQPQGRSYKYDLDAAGSAANGMMLRLKEILELTAEEGP